VYSHADDKNARQAERKRIYYTALQAKFPLSFLFSPKSSAIQPSHILFSQILKLTKCLFFCSKIWIRQLGVMHTVSHSCEQTYILQMFTVILYIHHFVIFGEARPATWNKSICCAKETCQSYDRGRNIGGALLPSILAGHFSKNTKY
jgi:hypothetical protein